MSEQIVQAEIRTLVDGNTEVYPRSVASAIGMEGEISSKTLKQVLEENTSTNSTQNQTLESHTSSINSLDSRLTTLEGSANKVEETFDYISEQPGITSNMFLTTDPLELDTWTTNLIKNGAIIATKIDAQRAIENNLDEWYTDIIMNGKRIGIKNTEQTDGGWVQTVQILQPEDIFIPSVKYEFSTMSWNDIAKVSNSGKASECWEIGDEKDIQVGSETLTFQIYGFNHDDLADGSGKAGITLGMKNLMATQRRMEATDTNANSFIGSEMYKWLNGECFNSLPNDLKSLIKPVNKKTSAGNQSTSIRTDAMKLWLFSENEVFGTKTYSTGNEGTKYPIFTDNNSRIKKLSNGTGDANWWWLRSPAASYSGNLCIVDDDGTATRYIASFTNGVCFGFCV